MAVRCVPGTLRSAAPPNSQRRPPSPRLSMVEATTVSTSSVKAAPSVTLPAALIATSCPTITLAMSADLLMSPIDTCKFGGMVLSTRLGVSSRLVQTRSLSEPVEAPVSECVGRYCQLRQGERFSQPHLEFHHALHVLAYNLTRVMNIMGIQPLMAAIKTA